MEKKNFKRGEIIFRENTSGDLMYIILSGKIQVYTKINNDIIKLATMEKGDFFGEMSLFIPTNRTATVEALEDTQVSILTKENLLHEIATNPEFGIKMMTTFVKRIKELHTIIADVLGAKKSLEIMYGMK